MAPSARDKVLDALSGKVQDVPPAAVFTQSATVGQMERTGAFWPEANHDPKKMAALGAAQADVFGFQSVRVPFGVTAEAEALGCSVFPGTRDMQPSVSGCRYMLDPFTGTSRGTDRLPDEAEFLAGTETVRCAVERLSRSHPDHPVVAGVTGMLTCMSQFLGAEAVVLGTLMCPDAVLDWSRRLERLFSAYVASLSDSGADIVTVGEAAASPDMMDPCDFGHMAGEGLKRLMSVGSSEKCLHICGNALPILDRMVRAGAGSLSIEGAVDPFEAVAAVGGKAALVGNVGPVDPLLTGTPTQVADAAWRAADAGFAVVAPGCGLPPRTPDANLEALSGYASVRRT